MGLFRCPKCHTPLQAPDSPLAQQVRCPHCSTVLQVPPTRSATTSAATAAPLAFRCPRCRQPMWARREHAGQPTRCGNPACQSICTIPGAAPPAPRPPAAPARGVRPLVLAGAAGALGLVTLLVALAGPSLIGGRGPAGDQDAAADKSGGSPAVSDLDFVPADAGWVCSVRVGPVAGWPLMQKARARLAERLGPAWNTDDFERITAVLADESRQELWVVARTTTAVDPVKRRQLLGPGGRWKGRRHGAFAYDLGSVSAGPLGDIDDLAVYQASERVLVVGTEAGLRRALAHARQTQKNGPLADLLPRIALGQEHLLLGVAARTKDGIGPFRLSEGVRRLILAAQFERTVQIQASLRFPDNAQAEQHRGERNWWEVVRKDVARLGDGSGAETPLAHLAKQLAAAQFDVRGDDVDIRVTLDAERFGAALLEALPNPDAAPGDNLGRIARAFDRYQQKEGHYPLAVYRGADGRPLYSWRVAILPYLGEEALYRQFDRSKPWDDPANAALLGRMPSVYSHPAVAGTREHTCYQLLTGPRSAFRDSKRVTRKDLTDGAGRTLLLVEHSVGVPWTQPADIVVPGDAAGAQKVLGRVGLIVGDTFPAAVFDGSVRRLRRSIAGKDFLHAIDPRDGVGLPAE